MCRQCFLTAVVSFALLGAISTPLSGQDFIRGDANQDDFLDVGDSVLSLLFLFRGGVEIDCLDAADSDDGGTLNIADPVYVLNYLFLEGPNPPAPFPLAGPDPTPADSLGCGVAPPLVTILSPEALSFFASGPVVVTGMATSDAGPLTVVVNGVEASVNGPDWSASVPLVEGNNVLTAVVTDGEGVSATASIQVTLDTTPPSVTVKSPADGFVSLDDTITVTGMINDVVVGTVNGDHFEVEVNGLQAEVSNRNFQTRVGPLAPGANTITVIGKDRVGNTATTAVSVVFREIAGEPAIRKLSGDGQRGVIGSVLTDPLAVTLSDAAGDPVEGQTVIFKVVEGNGGVGQMADGSDGARGLAVTTAADGRAEAFWRLGTRAGAGNQRVEAMAVRFEGTVCFTATALSGSPRMISVDFGNNQTGVVGQPLASPFVAVVTDAGFNRLGNVPVTFTVESGDGNFDGAPTLSVTTDSDGRASAVYTLGSEEGLDNHTVSADFAGNAGLPVRFMASTQKIGRPENTRVSGVVLDNTDLPIPGVTIRIDGTTLETITDAAGQFLLEPAPVGRVKLVADGSTVSTGVFPTLEYDLVTIAGQNNTVGMPIYLLPLDIPNALLVSETGGGLLTLPEVPGFSLSIEPGSALFPDGSTTGLVSVTLVHSDKIPMTPNFGQQPRFIVTIQPAGVHFEPPAAISIPNVDALAPGEVTEIYSFDHDLGQFVSIGTGTATSDGTSVASDPGVGIIKGGWHCGGNPARSGSSGSLELTLSTDAFSSQFGPSFPETTHAVAVGDTIEIIAKGKPPLDAVYEWDIPFEGRGRGLLFPVGEGGPSYVDFKETSSCRGNEECIATLEAKKAGGRNQIRVKLRCLTTGQEVTKEIDITVCEIREVYWVRNGTRITEANDHPSGTVGQKFFPGSDVPDGDFRDRIGVFAEVFPPVDDIPVYFKIVDPDDPSASADAVDMDTAGAEGGDNRDRDRGFFVDVGVRDDDLPDSGPREVSDSAGFTGIAAQDVRMAHQPGDNHRVAVALLDKSRLDMINDHSVPGSDAQVAGFEGKISPLMTTWRRLWIEVDSMEAVPANNTPNTADVDIDTITPNVPSPGQSTINLSSGLSGELDLYEGGFIGKPGALFQVLQHTDNLIQDDDVIISGVPTAQQTAILLDRSTKVTIKDDDARILPLDDAITPWIQKQYKRAYIHILEIDDEHNTDRRIPFEDNISGGSVDGARDVSSSEGYWSHLVVMVYQPETDDDADPDPYPNDPVTGLNLECSDAPSDRQEYGLAPCRPPERSSVDPETGFSPLFGVTVDSSSHPTAIFTETCMDCAPIENSTLMERSARRRKIMTLTTDVELLRKKVEDEGNEGLRPQLEAKKKELADLQALPPIPPMRDHTLLEATTAHEIGHGASPRTASLHHDIEKGIMKTGAAWPERSEGFTPLTVKRFRAVTEW